MKRKEDEKRAGIKKIYSIDKLTKIRKPKKKINKAEWLKSRLI